MKAIVIYFSISGRTKMVAEAIAAELSKYEVDIESITYTKTTQEMHKEQDQISVGDLSNFTYNEKILDLSSYDLITIGVPTHGARPACIFNGYIQKCKNLDGKKVVVFNTCRMYSGKTLPQMKSEIEKKGGTVIHQQCFKALFKMKDKKAREFGKILNQ